MRHQPHAETVYREYLASESEDFDALLDANSDVAEELRLLHQQYNAFQPHAQCLSRDLEGIHLDSTKASSASSDLPPFLGELLERLQRHSQAPRYSYRGEIARGGMGVVLRVHDEEMDREVAMKVILDGIQSGSGSSTSQEPRAIARFLEEAQVTGQLEHPSIVPVYDVGIDDDGRVYYTMPVVRGRDLRQVFEAVHSGENGCTLQQALRILARVAEAIGYAHSRGVIHRDLKPSNIMVGEFGEIYVMDWGLARVRGRQGLFRIPEGTDSAQDDPSLRSMRRKEVEGTADSPLETLEGTVVGTPAYMSPEQAGGELERVGPWSDLYSLGAILYELLAGTPPYVPPGAKVSAHTLLAMVLQGPPATLRSVSKPIPRELVSICEKAMMRLPELRYSDTAAFSQDLWDHLDGRVVSAHGRSSWRKAGKWAKRNRFHLAASVGWLWPALKIISALAAGVFLVVVVPSLLSKRSNDLLGTVAGHLPFGSREEVEALVSPPPFRILVYDEEENRYVSPKSIPDSVPKMEGKVTIFNVDDQGNVVGIDFQDPDALDPDFGVGAGAAIEDP